MGITALISTILGLLGGTLPDLVKEWRDGRQHARELEFQREMSRLQVERAQVEAGAKVEEAQAALAAEEARQFGENLRSIVEAQSREIGIAWVDALNAAIRPIAATLIMALFVVTAGAYVWCVLAQYMAGGIKDVAELATTIWGSMIGFSMEAVLGFLFGARQARKSASA